MKQLGIENGVLLHAVEGSVAPRQVHGDLIVRVEQKSLSPECDGISTSQKGLMLTVRHADCQPAIFFDPVNQALSLVHCGWKGNVQNIYQKTVEHMEREYGTKAEDLYLAIGPSLGPENAEFIHYKTEFPESFWPYQIKPNYFDLWEIAFQQAKEAGILSGNIEIARIDTFGDPKFPSYRRDKTTNRMVTFALLS